MTAKEYLGQAYRLDQRINSKLEQVCKLRSLTQKVTASYDSEPVSHTRNVSSLQDTVIHLMEAENELNRDIDTLVELKRDIYALIQKVSDPEYQLLLEMRYLCFRSWSEIAVQMQLDDRYVYKVHGRALQAVEKEISQRGEKDIV